MVNGGDVFICVVVGLALPLAMLDGYRALAGVTLQGQFREAHLERRLIQWFLVLLLGPGLFAERMLVAWREGALSAVDGVNAFVITIGWAALHGFVVLGAIRTVLPV
jgi:hypothetical protein